MYAREVGENPGASSARPLLDRVLGADRYLRLLDIALLFSLLLLIFSPFGFLFFHLSFMLLVLGAFFWNTHGFVFRTVFWLSLNAIIVLQHLRLGQMDWEELLQTPLLAGVLVMVYLVARQREQSQHRLNQQTEGLALAREQIAESEKAAAVARLSGSVAHDLLNPLGAISNAAYYVAKRLTQIPEVEENPKIGEFLTLIREQVERSDLAISNLIFFTREHAPDVLPTDIHAIINRSISPLRDKKNVRVQTIFDDRVVHLAIDGYLLQYVFMNLVHNSLESMGWEGDLCVTTALKRGTFTVAFQDTGKGMDEETIAQIFEPQFTTKLKGAGLGMPICQQLVARHGGEILVDSKPGEGTTVTVNLPIIPLPTVAAEGDGQANNGAGAVERDAA